MGVWNSYNYSHAPMESMPYLRGNLTTIRYRVTSAPAIQAVQKSHLEVAPMKQEKAEGLGGNQKHITTRFNPLDHRVRCQSLWAR